MLKPGKFLIASKFFKSVRKETTGKNKKPFEKETSKNRKLAVYGSEMSRTHGGNMIAIYVANVA